MILTGILLQTLDWYATAIYKLILLVFINALQQLILQYDYYVIYFQLIAFEMSKLLWHGCLLMDFFITEKHPFGYCNFADTSIFTILFIHEKRYFPFKWQKFIIHYGSEKLTFFINQYLFQMRATYSCNRV